MMDKVYTFWLILNDDEYEDLKELFCQSEKTREMPLSNGWHPILYAWTDKKHIAEKFKFRSPNLYFKVLYEDDELYDEVIGVGSVRTEIWKINSFISYDISADDDSDDSNIDILTTRYEMHCAMDAVELIGFDFSLMGDLRLYDYQLFSYEYQDALDAIGYCAYYDIMCVCRDYPPGPGGDPNPEAEERTAIMDDLLSYGMTLYHRKNALSMIDTYFWRIVYINSKIPDKKGEIARVWES